MLLLTRRPMVFLLGIGSYPVTAASVLRPCRSHYGQGRRDLEANRERFSGDLTRTGPGATGAGRTPGAYEARDGVSPARVRRAGRAAGMVAGRGSASATHPAPRSPRPGGVVAGRRTSARHPGAVRTS